MDIFVAPPQVILVVFHKRTGQYRIYAGSNILVANQGVYRPYAAGHVFKDIQYFMLDEETDHAGYGLYA